MTRPALTPFIKNSFAALRSLRACWASTQLGDMSLAPVTAALVVEAMKNLLATKPMQENREVALRVLKADWDPEMSRRLLEALWPQPWTSKKDR